MNETKPVLTGTWQLMGNAPKNGTCILAYWAMNGEYEVIWWSAFCELWCHGTAGWGSDCWSDDDEEGPTHWMPLPDPPAAV